MEAWLATAVVPTKSNSATKVEVVPEPKDAKAVNQEQIRKELLNMQFTNEQITKAFEKAKNKDYSIEELIDIIC